MAANMQDVAQRMRDIKIKLDQVHNACQSTHRYAAHATLTRPTSAVCMVGTKVCTLL